MRFQTYWGSNNNVCNVYWDCKSIIEEVEWSTYGSRMSIKAHTYHTSCGSHHVVPFSPPSCIRAKGLKLHYSARQKNLWILQLKFGLFGPDQQGKLSFSCLWVLLCYKLPLKLLQITDHEQINWRVQVMSSCFISTTWKSIFQGLTASYAALVCLLCAYISSLWSWGAQEKWVMK